MGFHAVILVKTFHWCINYYCIGLILTKLGWFQHFSSSQNSILTCFEKKRIFFGFPYCSTREDLSIDVSITNVGMILMKLGGFLFSGYGQTDRWADKQTDGRTGRHDFGILIWKHVGTHTHKKKNQLKAQN